MFAYCLNNPVTGLDPCGTCFHRWDFWNDCEECSGRTTGVKWKDGVSRIAYHQSQEAEMEDELARVQRQFISDNIQTGINRRAYHIQMQTQAKYQQDMMVIKVAEFSKEYPLLAADVVATTAGLSAAYILALGALHVISIPAGVVVALDITSNASTIYGAYRTYSGAWQQWQEFINRGQ